MNLSDSIKILKNKIEDINNKVTNLIESSNLANAKAKDNETKVENVINTADNNLKNINENMKKMNIINDKLYSIEDTFLELTNTDYVGKATNFIDVYPSKFMIFGGADIGDKFTGSAEDWDSSSQKALVKIKISNENETKDLVYKIPSTLKNIKNIAFDRLDLVNMKLYQKCDMLKFTGSESWEVDTTVTHSKKNTIAFKMSIDGKGALKPSNNDQEAVAVSNNNDFIVYSCNFLNENDMQGFCFTQGGLLKIQIKRSSLATQDVNGFKTWLSTANLIIFFGKESESVTDITGEKIKLCPNTTIEMTNAVKPSKVEIKYRGSVLKAFEALKTSQSLEYEGKNITCENTLASRTSDMLIKGQTHQNTSKIESAGEKENKISILSKNKESADDIGYKEDKKEILLPVEGGLKSLPNDVYDTIEERNDGVYLVQRVDKVVLNGSEAWTESSWSMTNTFKFDFEIGLVAKLFDINATNQILCDTFKVVSRNSLDNVANREFESICPSNSKSRTLSITVSKTKLNNTNTTDAFKQWLRNNPVTVCYELETPIETKLDINSLDLEVYEDTTHIKTENAIQPTLSFKVPSNIGSVMQGNTQNINKLYKLIDEVIIPQLVNNSADIEVLKLK